MSGMNFEEFEQLTKGFKELAKDYDKFLGEFLTTEGMRCLASTKRRTPVDTGRLRNAWKLSGPFKKGSNKYVVIHNNVKYASFVEDGHRTRNNSSGKIRVKVAGKTRTLNVGDAAKGVKWVPGKHMARVALTEAQVKLPARFETAFKKFCKGKGIG